MIETQAFLFLALTGMIGHAVYLASGKASFHVIPPVKDETEEEPGIAFSSDRFQQSAKGDERPFWIE
ncbi:hypothetical protein J2847_000444 [Azospirillum agricola]|uniref:hypothetical protein n=1 Tax=Azospirillum agricola TaxID=1720247 RepID=UPI001AE7A686|nr:hypothetical protein [Azospirillum agricola]MBP2227177.1 hypothetical protein [Azospirillum agricola]